MAALTVIQAMVNTGKVNEGKRILIHNANDGIGHYAIQIAKHLGAHVTAASGDRFRDFIMECGADEHYGYERGGFDLSPKRFDFVLDTIGGVNIDKSIKVINWGGTLFINQSDPRNEIMERAKYDGVNAIVELAQANGRDMSAIAGLLKDIKIKTHIARSFPFDRLPEAHQLVETGDYSGKIIVSL